MSIVIKDMDMPKNCYLCRYSVCGRVKSKLILHCGVAKPMDFMEALEHRHKDCPLVEVKTPHGRICDLDAVYDAVERRYRVSSGAEHRAERDFLDLITSVPTIIEAEGKDDG